MQMEPGFDDLAARIREEMRLEAEEAEREAAAASRMRRSFEEVALEFMAHGDAVLVAVGTWSFVGEIIHVGSGIISLSVAGARVDLNVSLPLRLQVLRRALAGGRSRPSQDVATLRARLLELQMSGERIEVGVAEGDETLAGRAIIVGSDHIALGDRDPEWFVPFHALAFIRTTGETR
ncbi:MAG: hypothetical protein ACRDJG_05310 [Actinomycetota bacterium]